MSPDATITWLRDAQGDAHDDLNTFASLGDRFTVPAGRQLARAGEYGREAFFIVSGRVEVRRDDEVVATLGAGDIAGELAVTGDVRRNADLVAASAVDLIVFDGASFRSALHLSASLAAQVEQARLTRADVA